MAGTPELIVEGDPVDVPDPPIFIACVGRKGQGKSELAWALWDSWEGDRLVLDTTADVGRLHPDPETIDLDQPPPAWPVWMKDAEADRLSLRYVPDHADPSYRDDMDRMIGLAFSHGDCLIWVEETGLVAPSGRVLPHTNKVLHMGRHQRITLINTFPRPMGVDPLVMAQADVIYCFDLPNPDDRKRLADVIGWDRGQVDYAISQLNDYEYLRFVTSAHELSVWPPLPLPKKRRKAQAHLEDEDPEEP